MVGFQDPFQNNFLHPYYVDPKYIFCVNLDKIGSVVLTLELATDIHPHIIHTTM